MLVALRRLNALGYIAHLSLTPFLAAPFPSYEEFIRLIRLSGFEEVGENKKLISLCDPAAHFLERRLGEVRLKRVAWKAGNWSDLGNRTLGYSSSTNASKGTPYASAIFVTVGI